MLFSQLGLQRFDSQALLGQLGFHSLGSLVLLGQLEFHSVVLLGQILYHRVQSDANRIQSVAYFLYDCAKCLRVLNPNESTIIVQLPE
jgi:hypothetical protein